jgi:hypothetical protein
MGGLRQYLNRLTKRAERDYALVIPQKGSEVARFKPDEFLEAFGHEMQRLKETYRVGHTTLPPHPLTAAVRNSTSEKVSREYSTLTFLAGYAEGGQE